MFETYKDTGVDHTQYFYPLFHDSNDPDFRRPVPKMSTFGQGGHQKSRIERDASNDYDCDNSKGMERVFMVFSVTVLHLFLLLRRHHHRGHASYGPFG